MTQYGSNDGYTEHVDSVRVMKADIERLRRTLMEASMEAIILDAATLRAVGPGAEGEPESARILRVWAKDTAQEIDRLIVGLDNMNERADSYLRFFGG
jgi:hypothetical protein